MRLVRAVPPIAPSPVREALHPTRSVISKNPFHRLCLIFLLQPRDAAGHDDSGGESGEEVGGDPAVLAPASSPFLTQDANRAVLGC